MPELPEVETVARGLPSAWSAASWSRSRPGGRPALAVPKASREADRREGDQGRRRAKYIVAELDDGNALLAHLGMSGRMLLTRVGPKFSRPMTM
jgi:formamidopyrimidine-DNA glycosylase